MLIARNLQKRFVTVEKRNLFAPKKTREFMAVNGVDLSINPGQIIGLLGINGAGKTTTIKMLAGLIQPTQGTFSINDVDGVKYPNEIKKIINVISGGERNLYWRLTARENLEYFGAMYYLSKKEIECYIEKYMELVGLNEVVDIPVERYSKGMKQRLQIARGLINDPSYLFLDEPTLGLDVAVAKEMRSYIKELARNDQKGLLLTSHYINEVEELCDYVYVLDHGKVRVQGSPRDIASSLQTDLKIHFLVSSLPEDVRLLIKRVAAQTDAKIEFKHENSGIEIQIEVKENISMEIVKIFSSYDLPILQLTISEPRLEDALIKMVMEEKS